MERWKAEYVLQPSLVTRWFSLRILLEEKHTDKPQLAELKAPPVDVNAALQGAMPDSMGGILGAMLGESPADAAARVEEAKKTATDLTGMVRKKAKPANGTGTSPNRAKTNGKRKAEDDGENSDSKKVKFVELEKAKVEDA